MRKVQAPVVGLERFRVYKAAGGSNLIQTAIKPAESGRDRLWTFRGLDPARNLYERFGFRLVRRAPK